MGRFERLLSDLDALPEPRREEIASWLETLVAQESAHGPKLSLAQVLELEQRLSAPEQFADDAAVDRFFAQHGC